MFASASGPRRVGLILLALLVAPVMIATIIVAAPVIAVLEGRRALQRRRVRRAFERQWGSHGMRLILAYSDDTRWRQRIEREWLPRIGRQTIVLEWSDARRFGADAPVERRLFEAWAGRRDFDPVVIVVPPSGRVRTLRFREAFITHFGGDEQPLVLAESRLFALAESLRDAHGVAAPADALKTGVPAHRNA